MDLQDESEGSASATIRMETTDVPMKFQSKKGTRWMVHGTRKTELAAEYGRAQRAIERARASQGAKVANDPSRWRVDYDQTGDDAGGYRLPNLLRSASHGLVQRTGGQYATGFIVAGRTRSSVRDTSTGVSGCRCTHGRAGWA